MTAYRGRPDYRHDSIPRSGVLLVNLGTPDAPTTSAVRRYLREFLWDPRVIEIPRLLWWCILQIILLVRPSRSAAAYRQVWTEQGSPLLIESQKQADGIRSQLGARCSGPVSVALGMRYGKPSIASALKELEDNNVQRLFVLPLYPQYSATTTGSVFDELASCLQQTRWLPELRFLTHYHDRPEYIRALADSVREHWEKNGRGEKLMLSFHGLPARYLTSGDPYHCECHKTARLLAEALGLEADEYVVSFQSRVGREEWLRPYTDETVEQLAKDGVGTLDVICPGFSADCLETLEEIAMQNAEIFTENGGAALRYVPCLNSREDHIRFLTTLCEENMHGWPEVGHGWSKHRTLADAERAQVLAKRLGADQ
ncbi:MAG: ferrochelatase [Gammaproteobacteria bacterium]|nr:ferrochelatase [Gammaproteobacteria bacterium]